MLGTSEPMVGLHMAVARASGGRVHYYQVPAVPWWKPREAAHARRLLRSLRGDEQPGEHAYIEKQTNDGARWVRLRGR